MNTGKYNIPGISSPIPPKNELHEQMQNTQGIQPEQPKIINVDLKVVGVTFANEDGTSRRAIIQEMVPMFEKGYKHGIDLVREPENKFDPNAIKVIADGMQIGYIGKEYASIMAPIMDNQGQFSAVVKGCGEFKGRPYCEITINQL
jgi:hypothetical protein